MKKTIAPVGEEKKEWYGSTEAAEKLGISRYTLVNRMRLNLISGVEGHYRRKNPFATKSPWLWHVDRITDFLAAQDDPALP